jgi:hypothetical protein
MLISPKKLGCPVIRQMRTPQSCQFQLRRVLTAVPQILSIDVDRGITVMPIKIHPAATWGQGGGNFRPGLHGGVLFRMFTADGVDHFVELLEKV